MRSALEPHTIVKHLLIQHTHFTSKISFSENQKGSSIQPRSALGWPAHHKTDFLPSALSKTRQGDGGNRRGATFPSAHMKLTVSKCQLAPCFYMAQDLHLPHSAPKPSPKRASVRWLQGNGVLLKHVFGKPCAKFQQAGIKNPTDQVF